VVTRCGNAEDNENELSACSQGCAFTITWRWSK